MCPLLDYDYKTSAQTVYVYGFKKKLLPFLLHPADDRSERKHHHDFGQTGLETMAGMKG